MSISYNDKNYTMDTTTIHQFMLLKSSNSVGLIYCWLNFGIYLFMDIYTWVNCHLDKTKIKIRPTSHLMRYINHNYIKISWNTINLICSKKSRLASATPSRQFWNLQQAYSTVFLIKLVNATIACTFSSSLQVTTPNTMMWTGCLVFITIITSWKDRAG